jgi:hypothetical protein
LRPTQHSDLTASVLDHAELLQLARGFGYALTSNAEHISDESLGRDQAIGRQAIQEQQWPSGQLLID